MVVANNAYATAAADDDDDDVLEYQYPLVPLIQCCGHKLHVTCHQSYLASLGEERRARLG
jgi:hypothetical protein